MKELSDQLDLYYVPFIDFYYLMILMIFKKFILDNNNYKISFEYIFECLYFSIYYELILDFEFSYKN